MTGMARDSCWWNGKRWTRKDGRRKMLEESIRYFENHLHQMHYRRY